MNKARLKVALIGAGGWGRQHARVFSGHPDVEFCAVVGRTEEKTHARAAEYGVRAYTDISEMLAREKPDLVSLCLPNQGHFEATLAVIQWGKSALLVEKPLVFDLTEADTLLAEAEKRGLFFAINFNHRYSKPALMASEAISSGRLGEIVFASWRFGGEGGAGHPHANLIETQCHGFDTLEHLCGPISSVMAQMTDKTGGGFRTLALALGFENEAVGTLLGSYDASYAYPGTQMLEVSGTLGRIVVEDTVRKFSFQLAGSEIREEWSAGYFNDRDREFHRTFDTYLDAMLLALKSGQPPPVPAAAGRRALALAMASIESFETSRRVTTAERR